MLKTFENVLEKKLLKSQIIFSEHTRLNAWWIIPLIVIVTWAVGASICWAQGGRISELGWYWIKCVKR